VRLEQEGQEEEVERLQQEHHDELQSLAPPIETLKEEISQSERDCLDAWDAAAVRNNLSRGKRNKFGSDWKLLKKLNKR
jgi:hypothetical protein